MKRELRHHGLAKKYFLKYYPRLQPWQLRAYKLRETIKNKGGSSTTKLRIFRDSANTNL